MQTPASPFALDVTVASMWRRLTEAMLGLKKLDTIYRQLRTGRGDDAEAFLGACRQWLDLQVDLPDGDQQRLPRSGGCLVVANHPMGGADGILLLSLLRSLRPDVKVLANQWLCRLPELQSLVLPVDVFRPGSCAQSARAAVRWLRAGGCLLVFPAGAVAPHAGGELPWSTVAGQLQRLGGVPVLPIHVSGDNGLGFRMLGKLHPRLRTALLPRALLRARGSSVSLRIGYAVTPLHLDRCADDAARTDLMRLRVEILSRRQAPRRTAFPARPGEHAPLAEPVPVAELEAELAALPAAAKLLSSCGITACIVRARQAPRLLQEIGRLRELTFRQVGEGTGRELDLDRFDQTYLQLFLWSESSREIVGGYRLGPTDELLAQGGRDALYTAGFYDFAPAFLAAIAPALELGRSFVVPAYQRGHLPLQLLWRGIGAYVARHPRYRRLFGTVSIPADHDELSVQLMVDHLRGQCSEPQLTGLVTPRQPWRPKRRGKLVCAPLSDLDHVGALVRELDGERRGVPVLLREYLKLEGRLLGLNVDCAFHTIDALLLVDLLRTPAKYRRRYLGTEGEQRLLEAHCCGVG